MAEGIEGQYRHFILEGVTRPEPYRSPRQGGGGSKIPGRNRLQHGGVLLQQIDELREEADSVRKVQQNAGIEEGLGLQVEFESFPDIELAFERLARERYTELAFESLGRERSGIELLNVRHEENRTLATVFVPDGKLDIFENLLKHTSTSLRIQRLGGQGTTDCWMRFLRSEQRASRHSGQMLKKSSPMLKRNRFGGKCGCPSEEIDRQWLMRFFCELKIREWR